jgi:hypothetical protein
MRCVICLWSVCDPLALLTTAFHCFNSARRGFMLLKLRLPQNSNPIAPTISKRLPGVMLPCALLRWNAGCAICCVAAFTSSRQERSVGIETERRCAMLDEVSRRIDAGSYIKPISADKANTDSHSGMSAY